MEPKMIEYILGAIVALGTLVQISPLKINPWSWLGKTVGRAINGEVIARLDNIEKRQNKTEEKLDKAKAETRRYRVLRFGDELKNNTKHSEEMYNQILDDITQYELYCKDHPDFPNGRTVAQTEIIKQSYKQCLLNNDFL